MFKNPRIVLLCVALLAPVFSTGCTVDDAFPAQDGTFYCDEDSDCENPYVCETNINTCKLPSQISNECIDGDMDGYGIGDDNTKCDNPSIIKDPDDTNAAIFPGAREICDGIDNDADPTTLDGDIPCMDATKSTDCPVGPAATRIGCQDNKCVYVSSFGGRGPECANYVGTCMGGVIAPETPEACR